MILRKNNYAPARIAFLSLIAVLFFTGRPLAQQEPVGIFEHHQDIGEPKLKGSTLYNKENQTYRMSGAGINMWAKADQFQFAWKKIKGDFIVRATVQFIGKGALVENLKALSGTSVSMPRPETMYGQVCAAEMRDFMGRQYTARLSTEYSAIVYAVENNLSTVGCIPSNARAKETLAAKGIKVVYEGRPQPALPVVASPGLPAGDRTLIAKVLTNYEEGAAGDAVLKSLNVTGFTGGGEIRLRALTGWLTHK